MADRAIVLRAMVGSVVHVREDGRCRPATVLDCGGFGAVDVPVPTYLLLRIMRPSAPFSAFPGQTGSNDQEGWFYHVTTAPWVPVPGGVSNAQMHRLDAWHWPDDHDPDCRRFDLPLGDDPDDPEDVAWLASHRVPVVGS
jgi:hypothetical protein